MTDKVKPKILLIEDDPLYTKICKEKFHLEGLTLVTAKDGVEGVKLFWEENPDLTLVDLLMPLKDGFETISEIRKAKEGETKKIIILTNIEREKDRLRAQELNVLDYVVKANLSIGQLVERVRKFL